MVGLLLVPSSSTTQSGGVDDSIGRRRLNRIGRDFRRRRLSPASTTQSSPDRGQAAPERARLWITSIGGQGGVDDSVRRRRLNHRRAVCGRMRTVTGCG